MALGFLPKITNNFKSAYRLQTSSESGFWTKIKSVGSCMTACISLSLEDSVKTVQSMKSRGYATVKRTFYSPKKFRTLDYFFLLIEIILLIFVIFAFVGDCFICVYYPQFEISFLSIAPLGYTLYFLYFAMADIFEFCGVMMWKALR